MDRDTPFTLGIRRRAHIARTSRGFSYRAAQLLPDAPWDAIAKLESGDRAKVTFPLVVALCKRYEVSLAHMLMGWPGWSRDTPPPRSRPPVEDGDTIQQRVASRLAVAAKAKDRGAKGKKGMGTVLIGRALGTSQSTAFRYLRGDFALHIGAAHAIAEVLGVDDFMSLILPLERTDDDRQAAGDPAE